MNPEEYDKMYKQENTYWWFQGRKDILFRMMKYHNLLEDGKARVLDIGCGTGLILEEITDQTFAIGMDFSMKALGFCQKRNLKHLVRGDVSNLPIASGGLELVLALDLLEHIEDDGALMKEIHRILKPGGYLLATVPAHPSLWSGHDEALHHFRRYTKQTFSRLVRESRFSIKKYSYVISFTFYPIFMFRMAQKLYRFLIKSRDKPKTHIIILPKIINSLLIKVLELEGWILQYLNLPFGVSLLCIARKKKN